MKKMLPGAACLSLAALVAVGALAVQARPDIEGTWVVTGGFAKGQKVPEQTIARLKITMQFKQGDYSVSILDPARQVEAGSYAVDARKQPGVIDMTIKEGKEKGKMQLGIFKVEGDQLTLALATAGSKERPKSFEPVAGMEVTILKRQR